MSVRGSDDEHPTGVEQLDGMLNETQPELRREVLDQLEHQDRVHALVDRQEVSELVLVSRVEIGGAVLRGDAEASEDVSPVAIARADVEDRGGVAQMLLQQTRGWSAGRFA